MARREVGRDLGGFVLDWAGRADAYVQFTVPEFEYPRPRPSATVPLRGPAASDPRPTPVLPEWWSDLDGSRPIVHVTQGTIANSDFGQLVQPDDRRARRIQCPGRGVDRWPTRRCAGREAAGQRAGWLSTFPMTVCCRWSMCWSRTVDTAACSRRSRTGFRSWSPGRPRTRSRVCARVGWSGAGVNLRTSTATPTQVARAVDRVRSDPSYRANAERIGTAMRDADAWRELDRSLDELAVGGRGSGAAPGADPALESAFRRTWMQRVATPSGIPFGYTPSSVSPQLTVGGAAQPPCGGRVDLLSIPRGDGVGVRSPADTHPPHSDSASVHATHEPERCEHDHDDQRQPRAAALEPSSLRSDPGGGVSRPAGAAERQRLARNRSRCRGARVLGDQGARRATAPTDRTSSAARRPRRTARPRSRDRASTPCAACTGRASRRRSRRRAARRCR